MFGEQNYHVVDGIASQNPHAVNGKQVEVVYDDGRQLVLGKGESATLSGGERVTVNQDGSLVVNDSNRHGGTIATTLRATGSGVDVTTHAHDLALGGDAIAHDASVPRTPNAPQPRHTTHTAPPPVVTY